MSIGSYRSQVDRLAGEVAAFETKAAGERERASKERSEALRISGSVTKSTSPSTAKSRARDAQRHEERAANHDRQAAQYASRSAMKRKALSDAQNRLGQAEAAERKKIATETERARRADDRRQTEIDRARRTPVEFTTPSHAIELASDREEATLVLGNVGGRGEKGDDLLAPVVPLDRRVTRLEPESTVEATLEVAKALALGSLSAVPVLGPILREVIGIAWGDNRAARVERFATELARDVEGMLDRIDRDFVKREEFGALAEETLERVVLRRNEPKISGFSAAVAHSATQQRPDQRTRERFLDWLDQLRPIHLEILRRLGQVQVDWVRPPDALTVGQVANSRVGLALEGLEIDRLDMRELEQRGLIHSLETDSLLLVAEDVRALVTPAGREFLTFISADAARLSR